MGSGTITKEDRGKVLGVIEGADIEEVQLRQMELSFIRPYGDIALKEAVRSIKAIAKEAIRLGAVEKQVAAILEILSVTNPIIVSGIDAIEDALSDD